MRTEIHLGLFDMPSRTSVTMYMAEVTIMENCTHVMSDK